MVVEGKGPVAEPMNLVLNEEDLAYEEEILRNAYSIKVRSFIFFCPLSICQNDLLTSVERPSDWGSAPAAG